MVNSEILLFAIGGASIAIGLAGAGASLGQRMAASASSLLMSEKPERFGLTLILTVLVETSAIYGLLIAILILASMGAAYDVNQGVAALAAGFSVGISGFFTGIGEGIAASASIGGVAEKEGAFGKFLVLTVLPETGAIYGLLNAVLILRAAGFLGEPLPGSEQMIGTASIYATLVIALTSVCSYLQGRVGASAISATTKKEETFGRDLIFVVLLESVLIYGLLVSILILTYSNVI
ncbi:MAG: V-type ATP synthase subunit K [Candidatus Bathyarchaeia archaeon]